MTSADVSVVIPVYNGARYLAEAIDSVLTQTHASIDLIVVDDGSEDQTRDVVEHYGDVLRYDPQEHRGIGAATNRGVELATGDYVAFLDADDRFSRDRTRLQLAAFDKARNAEAVTGLVEEFVSPELDHHPPGVRQPWSPRPWFWPSTILIRREALERVGLFSTTLPAPHIEWCARAADVRLETLSIASVVLERRLHAHNWTAQAPTLNYTKALKAVLDRRRGGP